MQIGGAGSLPGIDKGFDRDKEQLRLTELKAVHKVEREKYAQPDPDNTANKAASANARAFFARGSEQTSSATQSQDIPADGTQVTLASSQTSQTLFYAQQIASAIPEASTGNSLAGSSSSTSTSHSEAVEAYREVVGKTPGERMRAQVLRSLGITEEELEQLPPEERKKIEEKVAQLIDEKVKNSVTENIAEQEGPSGQSTSREKDGTGYEQATNSSNVGAYGNTANNPEEERSDDLRKSLMKNLI
ncbi:hypothetical protein [Kiloniella sp.]|uniref:hypothetical protein n=1 Tax=Kiloniella sp. TaxID=1938587 RepID=UPI003B01C2DD